MRYFILSDAHSNLGALEAVMEDMKKFSPLLKPIPEHQRTDRLLYLGDAIGYMAQPNEVMEAIWKNADNIIIGNHDLGVYWWQNGKQNLVIEHFNPLATWAIDWTARNLAAKNKERLNILIQSEQYAHREDNLFFVHSDPKYPRAMNYITESLDAYNFFFKHAYFNNALAFAGHIHIPQIYNARKPLPIAEDDIIGGQIKYLLPQNSPSQLELGFNSPWFLSIAQKSPESTIERTWNLSSYTASLVVVPSIGQPRDGLPYTGYAIYDSKRQELTLRRLPYIVAKTQQLMRNNGFPSHLIERLSKGK